MLGYGGVAILCILTPGACSPDCLEAKIKTFYMVC